MGLGIKFRLLKLAELINSMRIFLSRCIRARGYLAPGFLQCRVSSAWVFIAWISCFRQGSAWVLSLLAEFKSVHDLWQGHMAYICQHNTRNIIFQKFWDVPGNSLV